MSDLPYSIIAGLEVHVELATATKMFCRCVNDPFHASTPNQHVCPVCLGLPGALPVPNKEAIRKTVQIGLVLGSTFGQLSKWDRKHYFYPDLPKGYQISQFDLPFCEGGSLDVLSEKGETDFTIRFVRAHLEEDAGKLMHGDAGHSNVDLNRAGVPLLEMVTEPDFTSATQARRFLQELQLVVRTLGVSDADMEKGQMRCDVNINISFTDPETGKSVRTPITEVKNVNSTRAVERSIATEAQRQYEEWISGGQIKHRTGKITVGWDEDSEQVNLQRAKEGSADYRYMPEPDLPPVNVYADPELNPDELRKHLPIMPNERRKTLMAAGVSFADVETLLQDGARFNAYLAARDVSATLSDKVLINWVVNAGDSIHLSAAALVELISVVEAGDASFSAVKARLPEIQAESEKNHSASMKEVLGQLGLLQLHDDGVVESAIAAVLGEHASVVAEYKAGNERVFGFLVGQVMKQCAGKANPAKVNGLLKERINQLA